VACDEEAPVAASLTTPFLSAAEIGGQVWRGHLARVGRRRPGLAGPQRAAADAAERADVRQLDRRQRRAGRQGEQACLQGMQDQGIDSRLHHSTPASLLARCAAARNSTPIDHHPPLTRWLRRYPTSFSLRFTATKYELACHWRLMSRRRAWQNVGGAGLRLGCKHREAVLAARAAGGVLPRTTRTAGRAASFLHTSNTPHRTRASRPCARHTCCPSRPRAARHGAALAAAARRGGDLLPRRCVCRAPPAVRGVVLAAFAHASLAAASLLAAPGTSRGLIFSPASLARFDAPTRDRIICTASASPLLPSSDACC
jgi:hypothetical protein